MKVLIIGSLLHYFLTKDDIDKITASRDAIASVHSRFIEDSVGPEGNPHYEGDVVAMIVTAVHSSDCVNGQLVLDGNDSLWVTSRTKGEGVGQWQEPEDSEGASSYVEMQRKVEGRATKPQKKTAEPTQEATPAPSPEPAIDANDAPATEAAEGQASS